MNHWQFPQAFLVCETTQKLNRRTVSILSYWAKPCNPSHLEQSLECKHELDAFGCPSHTPGWCWVHSRPSIGIHWICQWIHRLLTALCKPGIRSVHCICYYESPGSEPHFPSAGRCSVGHMHSSLLLQPFLSLHSILLVKIGWGMRRAFIFINHQRLQCSGWKTNGLKVTLYIFPSFESITFLNVPLMQSY
jgi:hypothetical protein